MGRFGFLGGRLLQLLPVALGITILTFFLLRLIPGDPATVILGSHYTPQAAAALNKSFGEAGAEKLMQEFNNTIISSHSEVRKRRWDLTGNPPADAAAAKTIGEARWVYTIIVHMRPGQEPSFEGLIQGY